MGAPVGDSDDGRPSRIPPKSEKPKDAGAAPSSRATELPDPPPWRRASRRGGFEGDFALDSPNDIGVARSRPATEAPWKRNPRREVFEGDVSLVELRSRLALRADRIPEPAAPVSTARTSSGVLRLMSGVAMLAAASGVVGYFWGFKLSINMPGV